tara:strand:+ start:1158 stop:1688 length:531 start_codon:yes stop_codon:yes gene_type:complete
MPLILIEMIIDLSILLISIFVFISLIWLSALFFGAPFQPSYNKEVRKMIEFANLKKGNKVVDLGSGNGKIVIAFAKKGIESHGFEINPILAWLSRRKIKRLNLQKKAFIHRKNFWNQNFSDFDIITIFQIGKIMPKLESKLQKELKKGAKVISNIWIFPNWKYKEKKGEVYLYEVL